VAGGRKTVGQLDGGRKTVGRLCSGAESDDFAILFIINGRSIAARGLAGDHGGAAQGSEGTGGKIGSHGTYGFFDFMGLSPLKRD